MHKTLFKMDPQRYGQTIGDLNQRPEAYPIWADIDFLERANTNEKGEAVRQTSTDVNIEIKQLRFEIMKLRHENKDFAAELDKAQNLLKLQ